MRLDNKRESSSVEDRRRIRVSGKGSIGIRRIGDDALQKKAQGYAVSDIFTQGTSKQRRGWFNQGLKVGDVNKCDTFIASNI